MLYHLRVCNVCVIVKDMYTEASTSISTEEGTTDPIALRSGVHQGDFLIAILFVISINPMLDRLAEKEPDPAESSTLAYADDITPTALTPSALQKNIDIIEKEAKRISIHLNQKKCVSMHFSAKTQRGCRPTNFKVNGSLIKHLMDSESSDFLGKPVGFHIAKDDAPLEHRFTIAEKILTSSLAPWQRIDAMKTFFYPSCSFAMRTAQFGKVQCYKLDKKIRPLIKKTLNLPIKAANEYIYGSTEAGPLGIPLLAEESDLCIIANAFKLLTSGDLSVRLLGKEDLMRTIGRRLRSQDCQKYESSLNTEDVLALKHARQYGL